DGLRAFDILSRTNGRRTTDRFEIYPPPDVTDSRIELVFFTRGIRYLEDELRERWISGRPPEEPLELEPDTDNPVDPDAQWIVDGGGAKMGYLPWYYTASFAALVERGVHCDLSVRQHNRESTYPQYRFLIEFEADRPPDWEFPDSELYAPVDSADTEGFDFEAA
ncbi:MAG: HIRAN domain-containing protein, partial [Bradymonadaceae bacterium]